MVPQRFAGLKVDLRKALFLLPNLLTCASIFFGFEAVVVVSGEGGADRFARAAALILVAMFLDTIDGRLARLTRTQSAFGVQLDSLADLSSFGVAPAILAYRWCLDELGAPAMFVCFLYVAGGAVRLARFNVMTMDRRGAPRRPSKYILGLPIPGAAGLIVALVVLDQAFDGWIASHPPVVLGVVLGAAVLMVSALPFRSFKDLRPTPVGVGFVFVVGTVGALLALWIHVSAALAWLLGMYVALALVESLVGLAKGMTIQNPGRKPRDPGRPAPRSHAAASEDASGGS